MQTDNLIRLFKEKKEKILNAFEMDGLGIFGSYAEERQHSASDADILVFPIKDTRFTYK